jgi:hypothetical protein
LIKTEEVAQKVCLWMFKKGASRIHTLDEASADLCNTASYFMVEEAIAFLAEAKFIIVTGSNRNVFFAHDPLLAHTIGVAMSDPQALEIHSDYFKTDHNAQQLLLRLEGPNEPEKRSRI